MMRRVGSVVSSVVSSVVLAVGVAGCGASGAWPTVTVTGASDFSLPAPPPVTGPVAEPSTTATLPAIVPLKAATQNFTVASRIIDVTNGDRTLPTLLFYPEQLPGQFPLVLFSHGLKADPADYGSSLRRIARAGFVVAAPTYPHTSRGAADYDPVDIFNQPADASAVITAVLALGQDPDDPLGGGIDPDRVAAMGHSAGGYTTVALLSAARDDRIRSAVVLAGSTLGGAFQGPPASVLFVHGDADEVVPYEYGRIAYDRVPWPKAFLTVLGGDHAAFGDDAVVDTVLDFLRATLYLDSDAFTRFSTGAGIGPGLTFESSLLPPPQPSTMEPSPTVTP